MPTTPYPFCIAPASEILGENALAFAIRNKYPLRPLHSLVITKRHVADVFAAPAEEREAMRALAASLREAILCDDPTVGGFNFGSNVGAVAGQKILRAHLHLIRRRAHEAEPPHAGPRGAAHGCGRRKLASRLPRPYRAPSFVL